jgi:hypothetical protein
VKITDYGGETGIFVEPVDAEMPKMPKGKYV